MKVWRRIQNRLKAPVRKKMDYVRPNSIVRQAFLRDVSTMTWREIFSRMLRVTEAHRRSSPHAMREMND